MKKNHVRHKLRRGEPSFGSWLSLPGVFSAQLMGRMGFDWLTLELEHSPASLESAGACIAVLANARVAPLVRVPVNSVENIKRALDIGAWGVVVPMVNSRAEAEAVVEAARYRPVGRRSIGGNLHAASFETDAATYYARANEEILVVIMAEHVDAVERADEIFSVPGIDAAFIGPNDLHASMGLPPAFESNEKEFIEAVAYICSTARKHGLAPGIHVADIAQAQRRAKEGFQFIALASDAGFMMAKAREFTSALGIGGGRAGAKY
jgi:4-hydroxy-2-oxoheptanedioate aldolase